MVQLKCIDIDIDNYENRSIYEFFRIIMPTIIMQVCKSELVHLTHFMAS